MAATGRSAEHTEPSDDERTDAFNDLVNPKRTECEGSISLPTRPITTWIPRTPSGPRHVRETFR